MKEMLRDIGLIPGLGQSLLNHSKNHYIWEVRSANRWDARKTAMQAAGTGQQKGPNSSLWQCLTARLTTNTSKIEWIRLSKFCLICHIYLTSCQPTTISSGILTTFCRENASTTSMRQKMLSKCLLIPKHEFLCYRNKQTYFSMVVVHCRRLYSCCWLKWFLFWLIKSVWA